MPRTGDLTPIVREWRAAAGFVCLVVALALAAGCAPQVPSGVARLLREIKIRAAQLTPGAAVPLEIDAAGYRFIEVPQGEADVRIIVNTPGGTEVFDAPGRRATPERACVFTDAGALDFRVVGTQPAANPGATIPVRVSTVTATREQRLSPAARAECIEARAALEPSQWNESLATQRAHEYDEAAQGWKILENDARAATAHLQAAWTLTRHSSDMVKALAEAGAARDAYRRAGDQVGAAHATLLMAIPRWELVEAGRDEHGKYFAGHTNMLVITGKELEGAAATFDAAKLGFFSAEARGEIGSNYYEQGRLPEAMRAFADAAERFRALQETGAATRMLANFSVMVDRSGNYREASAAFDRLLAGRDADSDPVLADILNNSAATHSAAGNFEQALPQFVRALQIHEASGDYAGMARSLNGLAATYMRLGLPPAALEYASQARVALKKRASYQGPTSENAELASELLAGNAQRALGNLPAAKAAHEAAVSYARNDAARAQARLELARDALAARNHQEARRQIAQAMALVGNRNGAQALQLELESARAAQQAGELVDAQRRLGILEGKLKAAGARDLELEAVHALAEIQMRRQKLNEALASNERSIQMLATLRQGVSSPELRARLTALYRSAYQLRVDILGGLRERERDAERRGKILVEMFTAADQASAGLVQEMSSASDSTQGGEEARGIAAEISLREQLVAAIESGSASQAPEGELRAEVARLRARYDAIMPATKPAGGSAPADYSAKGIRSDTAILFYLASSQKLARYLVARDRVIELPALDREVIARRAAAAFAELTEGNASAGTQPSASFEALARDLLPSEAQLAGRTHLIVVPDPGLAMIPFAALRRLGASGAALIEQADVTQALTLHDALQIARISDAERRVDMRRVALFYDPVFTPYDTRVKRIPAKAPAFPLIARLSGSAAEARGITEQLPKAALLQFSGFDATRDAVLSDPVAKSSVLHFATHAIAGDQWPHGSGLLLTGFSATGEPLNGFISSFDLLSRRAATDLVVLSACDTARGDATSGENVAGLARAFLGGGARRVIATRWPVDDADTARLMRTLYARLVAGDTVAAALRAAQRELIAPRDDAGDSRWAGFVLYERGPGR